MGGEHTRAAAHRVAVLAEETRAVAARVASASGIRWRSTAADAFRGRLAEQAADVRRAAESLDAAAEALARHAWVLEQVFAVAP